MKRFSIWFLSILLLSFLIAIWIAFIWIALSVSRHPVIAPLPPEGTNCPAGRTCFAIDGSSDGVGWTGDGCLYLYPQDVFGDGRRHKLLVNGGRVFLDDVMQIPVVCRKVTPK